MKITTLFTGNLYLPCKHIKYLSRNLSPYFLKYKFLSLSQIQTAILSPNISVSNAMQWFQPHTRLTEVCQTLKSFPGKCYNLLGHSSLTPTCFYIHSEWPLSIEFITSYPQLNVNNDVESWEMIFYWFLANASLANANS